MANKFVTPRLGTPANYVSPHFDGELMDGQSLESDFLNASGCGIRPICILTKACRDRQAAWQACVTANSAAKIQGKFGSSSVPSSSSLPDAPTAGSGAVATGMSTGAKVGIALAILGVFGGVLFFIKIKNN